MSFRGLLLASVLLALLGAGVWYSNRNERAEADKPAANTAPKLVTVPEDQARKIEIQRRGEVPVVLTRNGANQWEMNAPAAQRVDQDAANAVASVFNGLTWDRLIEEKPANLGDFGLADPRVKVALTGKDGKSHTVLVGDEVPAGGNFYAKLERDPRVFTLASFNKSNLDKGVSDLRDKRLLTFDSDKVSRVELTARQQTVEFGRNSQNEWQIVKPKPFRADSFQVEEALRKLKDARIDPSRTPDDAKQAAASWASGKPVATLKITDNAGAQTADIRKSSKGDDYFVRSNAVDGVYKLATDVAQAVDKSADDWRTRKLFDFNFSELNRVEVKDGSKTYAFSKSGEKWVAGGAAMDSTSVQALIDKLRDLASIKFVDRNLAGSPAMTLTAVSNQGKRTEQVQIFHEGNSFFARRENEPAVYELDSKNVEEIQRAAKDVKPAVADKAKK